MKIVNTVLFLGPRDKCTVSVAGSRRGTANKMSCKSKMKLKLKYPDYF